MSAALNPSLDKKIPLSISIYFAILKSFSPFFATLSCRHLKWANLGGRVVL